MPTSFITTPGFEEDCLQFGFAPGGHEVHCAISADDPVSLFDEFVHQTQYLPRFLRKLEHNRIVGLLRTMKLSPLDADRQLSVLFFEDPTGRSEPVAMAILKGPIPPNSDRLQRIANIRLLLWVGAKAWRIIRLILVSA